MSPVRGALVLLLFLSLVSVTAEAQSLGTCRWRTEPFCNVLTLTMTQNGAVFALQDFRAAFGLGESELGINTVDADGIALAAVKALEQRTRENAGLRARVERLEQTLERLLQRGALRAGVVTGTQWDDENVGPYSVAVGVNTIARGPASIAAGDSSSSNGDSSVALGFWATALGNGSVALGSRVVASAPGTFLFGDRSTSTDLRASLPNQFVVRAAGGTRIYSYAGLTSGVELPPGAGAWSSISDANMKERFRDLDGGDVLSRIARMPIREWSYRAQDPSIRHVGPTAQDFHAAFGLGEDPLRISTIDADGIALVAVKALDARTSATNERLAEIDVLRAEVSALRAEMSALNTRR